MGLTPQFGRGAAAAENKSRVTIQESRASAALVQKSVFRTRATMMRTSETPSPLDFIGETHHMSRTCRVYAFALIGYRSRFLENRRRRCQSTKKCERPKGEV